MEHIDTVIIGGGQAGLATSYHLNQYKRSHVILEKYRIGEAWRSGKWDSFTLVTPNWMLNLPGFAYNGDDPNGFLKRDEVVQYLDDYVKKYNFPIRTGVEVKSVTPENNNAGFKLATSDGNILASNVVIATGTFQKPKIPEVSSKLPGRITQLHSSKYRNPDNLPSGAVLVVGSAQSGCQIADELNEHGRKVYLSTGRANRLPRRYRGKDSFWWAQKLGIFDQKAQDLQSPEDRFKPNPQVSGKDGGKTLNLHQMAIDGISLLGRLQDINDKHLLFATDLKDNLAQADDFANQFKKGVDNYIEKSGMQLPEDSQPVPRAGYDIDVTTELDLNKAGINSIIWATGYRYDYSWIKLPILDEFGYPIQQRGVSDHHGLYFVGLNWLHTRQSGLLSGVGDDAEYIVKHLIARS